MCIFLQKFNCGKLEIVRLGRWHVERVLVLFRLPSLFSEEMMSSWNWLIHSSQDRSSVLTRRLLFTNTDFNIHVDKLAGQVYSDCRGQLPRRSSFPAQFSSVHDHSSVDSFFLKGIKRIKGGTKCSLNLLSYTFTFRGLQAAWLFQRVPLTESQQPGNRTLSNTIAYKCEATGKNRRSFE